MQEEFEKEIPVLAEIDADCFMEEEFEMGLEGAVEYIKVKTIGKAF